MQNESLKKTESIITKVVNYLEGISFSDIPADVIDHTKVVILDTLGAMLAASHLKYSAGNILTELVRSLGGVEESTIIGRGFKSSCVNAALVNGTFGYYCDIEAHHPAAVVHPAATIVPTCLAVGEREKVDGKSLLLAFILGADIDCRVSLALNPRVLYDRGFHPSSIAGTIGAAAAAGRLLKLDKKQYPVALGLAAQQTSGLLAWKEDFSENSRPFNHSIAARNGVIAGLLAKSGFGGPPDIFEGIYNIGRAYSEEGGYNMDQMLQGIGSDFKIMGLAFKRYSCCAFLHPGLDALLAIMGEQKLESKDIDRIVLRFPKNGAELIDGTELRSHSAQYIFPVASVSGKVMIDDILHDRRLEPEIDRLVEHIRVVGDEELDEYYPERYTSIVEVTTMADKTFSKRVDYAAGTPQNPFDKKDIEGQFFELSEVVVEKSIARKIRDMVGDIENVEDVNRLGSLLSGKG